MTQTNEKHEQDHRVIPIFIDEVKYDAPADEMTGAALRALPQPPLGDQVDLWLETHGPGDDEVIRPEVTYRIKPGSKYYTAPSTINPGCR